MLDNVLRNEENTGNNIYLVLHCILRIQWSKHVSNDENVNKIETKKDTNT